LGGIATMTTAPSTTTDPSKTTLCYLWYGETLISVKLTNSVVSPLQHVSHGQILITFKQLMSSVPLHQLTKCQSKKTKNKEMGINVTKMQSDY
jgi:hypothetical protein